MSDVISVRLATPTRNRLDQAAQERGESRSALLNRLVEEGLRLEAHPGIEFRPGPAGRRPAVKGGPDVWEVARFIQNSPVRGNELLRFIAEELVLTDLQVQAAVDYYAEFKAEIDNWITALDQLAEREEAAWLRRQALLG